MNFKSHHQDDFIQSLSTSERVEIAVIYYNKVSSHRLEMGWESGAYAPYEYHFKDLQFDGIKEKFKDFLHIVGSAGSWFHLKILRFLSKNKIQWMTWSEPSFPGFRWYLTFPYKLIHAFFINQYSTGLLAIGKNAQNDYARKGVSRKKMHFLPYSVNGYQPKECNEINDRRELNIVLIPGQLCKRKATDIILKSIRRLIENAEKVPIFRFIGNGDLELYRKMAGDLGVQEYVDIIGPIESSKVQSYYCQADVVILFSRFDGWGMVINEAISMGVPVISNLKVGSARHLVKHNSTGFLAEDVTAENLSSYLLKYMEQPSLLNVHGEAALQLFSEFTPKKNADRLANILDEMNVG